MARHLRNRPCPVTSRIKPLFSIKARLRGTAARLTPVRASAIGAETRGHSAKTACKASAVLPQSGNIVASGASPPDRASAGRPTHQIGQLYRRDGGHFLPLLSVNRREPQFHAPLTLTRAAGNPPPLPSGQTETTRRPGAAFQDVVTLTGLRLLVH